MKQLKSTFLSIVLELSTTLKCAQMKQLKSFHAHTQFKHHSLQTDLQPQFNKIIFKWACLFTHKCPCMRAHFRPFLSPILASVRMHTHTHAHIIIHQGHLSNLILSGKLQFRTPTWGSLQHNLFGQHQPIGWVRDLDRHKPRFLPALNPFSKNQNTVMSH